MAYGQYSYAETAGRRMTMQDKAYLVHRIRDRVLPIDVEAEVFDYSIKSGGHNRAIFTFLDKRGQVLAKAFTLHDTAVVVWYPIRRVVEVRNGGYPSLTTNAAISQAGEALELPYRIGASGTKATKVWLYGIAQGEDIPMHWAFTIPESGPLVVNLPSEVA